jgi:hypothetical protein
MTYFRGSSIDDLLGILFLNFENKEPDLLDTALEAWFGPENRESANLGTHDVNLEEF